MREEDKREFKEIVTTVMDVYGKEVSAPILRLWWAALEPFSIAEVRHGLTKYVRSPDSGTFAPKPADIIRMIEGTAGDRGMIAWGKVQEAIGRVGGYQSVAFDDPIIHVCIEDMGGWPKLCATESQEMTFRAAEFAKRYRAHAEAGIQRFAPYLTGRHESENRIGGYKVPPPVLIGDPDKALLVIEKGSEAPALQITRERGNVGQLIAQALAGKVEGDEKTP